MSNNNRTILALDLGTKTGWAVHSKSGIITSGTINFKASGLESSGVTFLKYKKWLVEMKNRHGGFDYVYFEKVCKHLGLYAAHKYGGFLAHLTSWCELHQIPYQGVPVGTIKKHITGKGNASKAEVIAAIRAKGFDPKDDNEADSLALLDLILNDKGEKYHG
jgi:Holliday junction resolvasome RuvABC endonuclease subunit